LNSTKYKIINSLYLKKKKEINSQLEKIFKKREPQSLYSPASYILKNGGKRSFGVKDMNLNRGNLYFLQDK